MTTYTHTPKIAALPRKNIGEDNEVITEIHVSITTTDDQGVSETKQAFSYAIPQNDLKPPYVTIDELDADTILGWVPAETMDEWEASMEKVVALKAADIAASAVSAVPDHLA